MAEKLFIQWCQVLPTYPVTSHLLKVTYSKWLKVPEKVSCYKVYFLTEIFQFSGQKPTNAILLKSNETFFSDFQTPWIFWKIQAFKMVFDGLVWQGPMTQQGWFYGTKIPILNPFTVLIIDTLNPNIGPKIPISVPKHFFDTLWNQHKW